LKFGRNGSCRNKSITVATFLSDSTATGFTPNLLAAV
jgi:hypothetical protein